MRTKYIVICALLISAVVLSSTIDGQDGKSVVGVAAKAMGAENLKTLVLTGSGTNAGIGQNIDPNSPWPLVQIKTYTRSIDFEARAANFEATRIQNNANTTQNLVTPGNAPWDQWFDVWVSTPYMFLKGAMEADLLLLRSDTVNGVKYRVVSFTLENKYKVEGYISDDNMVGRVRTWIDNDVLGDMLVDASYSEYKDFGGLKVPALTIVKQGNFATLIAGVNDAKVNAPVTIPAAPPQAPLAAVAVDAEKIADGVYYLKGGTHHSVLVEFADHVTLIEAPQNEARSIALLAEVKKLYPTKPLTEVVNTHHHFDHSGGLRTFVDAGATIVTSEVNKSFYEKTFTAPHTLNPDRLQLSRKAATIKTVGDKLVLSDNTRTVELHLIKNNAHNQGMLMAFLPKEKILIEVDMYTPAAANAPATAANAPVNPNALALLDNLEKLRLDFDDILPLHGPGKVTRADLYAFTKKPLVPVSALPDPNAPRGGRGARGAAPAPVAAATGPDAPLQQLVNLACAACHNLDRVNVKKGDRSAWQTTVIRMRDKGAVIPDDQFEALIDYLAKIHPVQ